MAGPSSREDSPQGRASAGTSGAVTGIPAIVVLLATGLILRLIIAYVLLPGSGQAADLATFQAWGNDIAQQGPVGFYARNVHRYVDYPPVYLSLLGAFSFLTSGFTGLLGVHLFGAGEGVKIVPILADEALAAVVWLIVRDLGVSNRRALIAAAIVLVNPVTWFNSAIWGQADAVGSVFLLLGLRELQKDRRETASALAVLAILTKLQVGVLGVLVGFVVLRRSLWPRSGEPQPQRILSSIGAGLAVLALICLPFTGFDLLGTAHRLVSGPGLLRHWITIGVGLVGGLGVFSLGRRYLPVARPALRTRVSALLGIGTAVAYAGIVFDEIAFHLYGSLGEYPFLTVNAFNPWALVTDAGNALDSTMEYWYLHDAPWTDASAGTSGPGMVIGPFPGAVVLAALAAAALLVGAAVIARRLGRRSVGQLGAGSRLAGALIAEFSGLWAAFFVAAAVIVFVALAAMTGRLHAAALGEGLLVAILLGVSLWAAWRDDTQSLLVALAILVIAFFVLPTRAHERYLYPFFGVGAVLLAVSRRWTVVYVILSAVSTANLLAVLVEYNSMPPADGPIAGTLNSWGNFLLTARWFDDGIIWPVAFCGVATGLAMVWALLQMRSRAVEALARAVGRVDEGQQDQGHRPGRRAWIWRFGRFGRMK